MNQKNKRRSRRASALAVHYERKALREVRYARMFHSSWYLGNAWEAASTARAYREGMPLRVRDILPFRKFTELVWAIEDGLYALIGLWRWMVHPDLSWDLEEEEGLRAGRPISLSEAAAS